MIELKSLYKKGIIKADNYIKDVQDMIDQYMKESETKGYKRNKVYCIKIDYEPENKQFGAVIRKPIRREIIEYQTNMNLYTNKETLTIEDNEHIFDITYEFISKLLLYPNVGMFKDFIDDYPLTLDQLSLQVIQIAGGSVKN